MTVPENNPLSIEEQLMLERLAGISPDEVRELLTKSGISAEIVQKESSFIVRARQNDIPYQIGFREFIGDPSAKTRAEVIEFVYLFIAPWSREETRAIIEEINDAFYFVKARPVDNLVLISWTSVIGAAGIRNMRASLNAWHQAVNGVLSFLEEKHHVDN
jgi:hypothetical protein